MWPRYVNAILYIGACVAFCLPIREFVKLRAIQAELKPLEDEVAHYGIVDFKKAYIKAQKSDQPNEFVWSAFVPANRTIDFVENRKIGLFVYRASPNNSPPSRMTVRIRLDLYAEEWSANLETGTKFTHQRNKYPSQIAQRLGAKITDWSSYKINQAGAEGAIELGVGQMAEILSIELPSDPSHEAIAKMDSEVCITFGLELQ